MRNLWVSLTIGMCFMCSVAWADEGFYVTGSIGQSRFSLTAPDGTWRQEGLGYHATRESVAWAAGVGYRWDHWAIEGGYLDLGRVKSGGMTVDDAAYNTETRTCDGHAPHAAFNATDRIQAGTLKIKYSTEVWTMRPFLSAGVFVGHHGLNWWTDYGREHVTSNNNYGGLMAGPIVGGGICYKWLCGQVEYLRAVTQSAFPISTEIVMPSAVLNIPLKWE